MNKNSAVHIRSQSPSFPSPLLSVPPSCGALNGLDLSLPRPHSLRQLWHFSLGASLLFLPSATHSEAKRGINHDSFPSPVSSTRRPTRPDGRHATRRLSPLHQPLGSRFHPQQSVKNMHMLTALDGSSRQRVQQMGDDDQRSQAPRQTRPASPATRGL
jgi:hypothetical protein